MSEGVRKKGEELRTKSRENELKLKEEKKEQGGKEFKVVK